MTTITFRRPTTEPLHREDWDRPASGAGADDFRVTQQFNDPDFYWSKIDPARAALGHRATDIGNARCGYPLVAMAAGRVTHLRDNATALGAPTDALGIRLDVGHGITLEYWHLASWSVASGMLVRAGQEVGRVGKTGLGQVCHTHIEGKRDGARFDPEPLLFGGSITVGEEDDMPLPANTALLEGRIPGGNNLRKEPNTKSEAFLLENAGTFQVIGTEPKGGSYAIGGKTRTDWVLVSRDEVWWVAAALIDIRPTAAGQALLPAPSPGATQADLDAALEQISALTVRIRSKDAHVAQYPKG